MNTSKQVNVMIGLLFLAFFTFGAYIVYEPNRQATAIETQHEQNLQRGAQLFISNCRNCHGMMGLGGEEGALAPPLNSPAFLILKEDNRYGLPPTAEGEATEIEEFLFNSTACGRVNSAMPPWLDRYGGPLSERQVHYIVELLTTDGAWDVVEERARDYDRAAGNTPESVIIPPADAGTLSLTTGNCGQYQGAVASEFRNRDPFTPPGEDGEPAEVEIPDDPLAAAEVQGVLVGTFYANNCAVCHGPARGGGVGPPLTPAALTQAESVYADVIANGRPGTAMPAFAPAGLTDEDIANLVAYLKNVEP
jgi:mono/diheme cytochrome c family protein